MDRTLTVLQESMLLWKHTTGDFPRVQNSDARYQAVAALVDQGFLAETPKRMLSVTDKGKQYCDEHHMSMRLTLAGRKPS